MVETPGIEPGSDWNLVRVSTYLVAIKLLTTNLTTNRRDQGRLLVPRTATVMPWLRYAVDSLFANGRWKELKRVVRRYFNRG